MTQIPKHYLSMLDLLSQTDLLVFKFTSDRIFGKCIVTKACIFLKVCISDAFYCIAKIPQKKTANMLTKPIYICRTLSYFRFRYLTPLKILL